MCAGKRMVVAVISLNWTKKQNCVCVRLTCITHDCCSVSIKFDHSNWCNLRPVSK